MGLTVAPTLRRAFRYTSSITALALSVISDRGGAQGNCPSVSLPAYAHNDYQNERPLLEAVDRGLRGVEVDLFLIDGQLHVGHDRGEARRRGATLESMYLLPLRKIIERCGTPTNDGRSFLLAIELKESSRNAHDSLVAVLQRHPTLFKSAAGKNPPIEVVLVGWHPPDQRPIVLSEGDHAVFAGRQLAVHLRLLSSQADALRDLTDRVRVISVDYGKTIGRSWASAHRRAEWLAALRRVKGTEPGRLLRIHNVPHDAMLYAVLLDAGVDLIGVRDPAKAAQLLPPIR